LSPAHSPQGQFGLNQFGQLDTNFCSSVQPRTRQFNAYNRKVVKTELFEGGENHIKGDLKPLAFDKIRTFFDEYKNVSSQTLFKTDAYYLGYDNTTKEYILEFND
jgi:hypothetical protein